MFEVRSKLQEVISNYFFDETAFEYSSRDSQEEQISIQNHIRKKFED